MVALLWLICIAVVAVYCLWAFIFGPRNEKQNAADRSPPRHHVINAPVASHNPGSTPAAAAMHPQQPTDAEVEVLVHPQQPTDVEVLVHPQQPTDVEVLVHPQQPTDVEVEVVVHPQQPTDLEVEVLVHQYAAEDRFGHWHMIPIITLDDDLEGGGRGRVHADDADGATEPPDLRTVMEWRRTQTREILDLIPPPPTLALDCLDARAPKRPAGGQVQSNLTAAASSGVCEKRAKMGASERGAMASTSTSASLPLSSPPVAATAPGAASGPAACSASMPPVVPQRPSRKTSKALRRAAKAASTSRAAAPAAKDTSAKTGVFVFSATKQTYDAAAVGVPANANQNNNPKKRPAEEAAEDAVERVVAEPPKRARSDVLHVPLDKAVRELVNSGAKVVYRTGNPNQSMEAWSLDSGFLKQAGDPGTQSYVPLRPHAPEYQRVAKDFNATCVNKGFVVRRVARVENPDVLLEFKRRVEEMERLHGDVAVLRLYHGTHREKIHAICGRNLDVALAGTESKHIWWGRGVNFTPISFYSSHYGDPGRNRSVLVCHVAIAKVCSKQFITEAPLIDEQYLGGLPPGVRYDANMKLAPAAQVLCKFEAHEFYPAYIVDYAAPAAGHRQPGLPLQRPLRCKWWADMDEGDEPEYDDDFRNAPGPWYPDYRNFQFGNVGYGGSGNLNWQELCNQVNYSFNFQFQPLYNNYNGDVYFEGRNNYMAGGYQNYRW